MKPRLLFSPANLSFADIAWAPWWRGVVLLTILGVAGCAGTRTSGFQSAAASLPTTPPNTVLVEVAGASANSTLGAARLQRLSELGTVLQDELREKLEAPGAGLVALPVNGPPPGNSPGMLLLRSSIVEATEGNKALRLSVGFGAGKAIRRVHTELFDLGAQTPVKLASWDTNSTTGKLPGPALGLVGPMLAGQALGVVGGSVGVLLTARQTQYREVDESSTEIVAKLRSIAQTRGWAMLASKK